jgi:murein endopeptidase
LFQQRDENFEATLGMLMSALSQRRTLVSTVVMSAKGQKLPRASAAKRMLAWRRFIVAPSRPAAVMTVDISAIAATGATNWASQNSRLLTHSARRRDKRRMFVAPAISVTGAVGSPTNPLTIK